MSSVVGMLGGVVFWDDAAMNKFVQIEHVFKTLVELAQVAFGVVHRKENVMKGLRRPLLKCDAVAVLKNRNGCEFWIGTARYRLIREVANFSAQIIIVKIIGGKGCGH